jgi:hypothetical protein
MSDEKLNSQQANYKLPSSLEVKNETTDDFKEIENFTNQIVKLTPDIELQYIHMEGVQDHYKHKKWWSWFIMALMAILLIFQCTLLGLVGYGIWNFEKYAWLLPALLVQNLAQIVGLAVFVVKALFRDISRT